jgi:hypothetical protein
MGDYLNTYHSRNYFENMRNAMEMDYAITEEMLKIMDLFQKNVDSNEISAQLTILSGKIFELRELYESMIRRGYSEQVMQMYLSFLRDIFGDLDEDDRSDIKSLHRSSLKVDYLDSN